jgi:preprotein translocase subunit SecE
MSLATKDSGKKWIQASVAVTCILLGYVVNSFFVQMSEWFELETKINNFTYVAQGVSVLIGFAVFVYIMKNEKTSTFLNEVYAEAIKVIWPDKTDTNKQTIIIMIGVTIVGFILGFFDIGASWLLSLIA